MMPAGPLPCSALRQACLRRFVGTRPVGPTPSNRGPSCFPCLVAYKPTGPHPPLPSPICTACTAASCLQPRPSMDATLRGLPPTAACSGKGWDVCSTASSSLALHHGTSYPLSHRPSVQQLSHQCTGLSTSQGSISAPPATFPATQHRHSHGHGSPAPGGGPSSPVHPGLGRTLSGGRAAAGEARAAAGAAAANASARDGWRRAATTGRGSVDGISCLLCSPNRCSCSTTCSVSSSGALATCRHDDATTTASGTVLTALNDSPMRRHTTGSAGYLAARQVGRGIGAWRLETELAWVRTGLGHSRGRCA